MTGKLQSILIPKSKFNKKEAKSWIRSHDYKVTYHRKPVHETEKYWRFRQEAPKKNGDYYVKELANGIKFIFLK